MGCSGVLVFAISVFLWYGVVCLVDQATDTPSCRGAVKVAWILGVNFILRVLAQEV